MSTLYRQEEAWEQLSREIGAQFIKGELGKGDKVVAMEKQWAITLTAFTELVSKWGGGILSVQIPRTEDEHTAYMGAPYLSKDGFAFEIYFEGGRLGKLPGVQNVEVRYPDFAPDFYIRGNNESKVQALFANPKIRQLILDQVPVGFGTGEKGHGLRYQLSGLVTNIPLLKTLFELFAETLNQLYRIGSAQEEKPHIYDVPGGVSQESCCPQCNSEFFENVGGFYQCAACDAWFQ